MSKPIFVITSNDSERFQSLNKHYAMSEDKMKLLITQVLEDDDCEVSDIEVDLRTNEITCDFRDNNKSEWDTLSLSFAVLKPLKN